ncbi:hypothetical protein LJC20_00500 [Eubacteriales bacterium OttesenSCG-928-M02]|nr:hypothetical protein [Eubacteriales bacterium OttesenSCG-928-M02]
MPDLKTHGITENTPNNILLGAGTFYKNLKHVAETGWSGEVLGATSGGGTVNIAPEYFKPEIDGATVAVKGMIWKVGDVATIEANLTEFSEGVLVDVLHLKEDTASPITGYKKYVSVRQITQDDYMDNIGYVGTLSDGRQVIIILENAICTGAMELSPKNKENATYAVTFECTATFEQADLEHLPYQIYYPQAVI